jgi:hypothetical protein
MHFNNLNRIYFSRYFYSIFKSKVHFFNNRSDSVTSSGIFYVSNSHYYRKFSLKFNKNFISNNKNVLFTSFFFRNYFFPVSFNVSNFDYDVSWKLYNNNKDIFKNIFVIIIKFKLNVAYLMYFLNTYKVFTFHLFNFKR